MEEEVFVSRSFGAAIYCNTIGDFSSSALLISVFHIISTRFCDHVLYDHSEDHSCITSPARLLHHVMTTIAMAGGVLTPLSGFWACLALLCETSTFFLNFMCLLKLEGVKVEPRADHDAPAEDRRENEDSTVKKTNAPTRKNAAASAASTNGTSSHKKPRTPWPFAEKLERNWPGLVTLNSVALTFVFFACRILLFPAWLIFYGMDFARFRLARSMCSADNYSMHGRAAAGGAGASEEPLEVCRLLPRWENDIASSWNETVLFPVVIVLLLVLSAGWFPKLVAGTKKQVAKYQRGVEEGEAKKRQ